MTLMVNYMQKKDGTHEQVAVAVSTDIQAMDGVFLVVESVLAGLV